MEIFKIIVMVAILLRILVFLFMTLLAMQSTYFKFREDDYLDSIADNPSDLLKIDWVMKYEKLSSFIMTCICIWAAGAWLALFYVFCLELKNGFLRVTFYKVLVMASQGASYINFALQCLFILIYVVVSRMLV